jgi:tetratricopeptide (TPR) repeat protein
METLKASHGSEELKNITAERDNLKAELAGRTRDLADAEAHRAIPSAAPAPPDAQADQLRARLAVLEAQAVPYTPEELAVMRKSPSRPPTQLPAVPEERKHIVHSMKDLPPGAGGLMQEAGHSMMERDYSAAIEKYREILHQDQNNVYVLAHLASVQFTLGQLADSEKTLNRSLALDPEDPPSLYLMGILRYRQNKLDEALNALSLSAKYNPTNSDTQYYLGCVLAAKGMRSAAETALRKALESDPKYTDAHYSLACVYVSETPPSMELARWHYHRSLDLGHDKNEEMEKRLTPSP